MPIHLNLAFLKRKKSQEELRDEDERLEIEESIANREFSIEQKRIMIKRLHEQGVNPKSFSSNGKSSGISWHSVMNFLKNH